MVSVQQVRNVLALAQAHENGRAVPADRLILQAAAEGLAPRDAEAALAQLAREGLAQETPRGWTLRPAPFAVGVCLDHGRRVRLRH